MEVNISIEDVSYYCGFCDQNKNQALCDNTGRFVCPGCHNQLKVHTKGQGWSDVICESDLWDVAAKKQSKIGVTKPTSSMQRKTIMRSRDCGFVQR